MHFEATNCLGQSKQIEVTMNYWWQCKSECFYAWTSFEREVTLEDFELYTNHTITVDLSQDEDGCPVTYQSDLISFEQVVGESLTFYFLKDSCDDHLKTFEYQFTA